MPYFAFSLIFFLTLSCYGTTTAQTIIRLDNSKITSAALDKKIEQLMAAGKVQGLAISVFNKNEPIYKKTFGYKRLAKKKN